MKYEIIGIQETLPFFDKRQKPKLLYFVKILIWYVTVGYAVKFKMNQVNHEGDKYNGLRENYFYFCSV